LLRGDLLDRTEAALARLCAELPPDLAVVVGYPRGQGGVLFNSAGVISAGKLLAQYDKQCLPNYEVFDEKRYFAAGTEPCIVDVDGLSVGLTICEDIWHPEPAAQAKVAGAEILININASPVSSRQVVGASSAGEVLCCGTSAPHYLCQSGGWTGRVGI
jgi:NAD+ synthase (glutamine-hydrolysing)